MNRRLTALMCAWLLGALLLAGGSWTAFHAQETNPDKTWKIAVLTYSFSSEYWGYVAQGCLAYDGSDPAVDITVQGVSSSIASGEQIEILKEDLEHGRYDGYVIAAIDREEVEKILKDVDLPVVVVDAPLDAPCVIGRVGTENQIAATAGAKKAVAMAREIGWEKPSCVMIGGVEGDYNQESRLAGYRGGVMMSNGTWLAEVYPTDKSEDSARAAMEQIMKDYPEGLAVVACYNDLLAETALETAEANSAYDHTVFLGFDGNGSVCERIMNDDRYRNMVTVAQNPYEMGFAAVQMLSDYLRGQENASQAASIEGQGDSGGTASGDSGGTASGAAGGAAGGDTDGGAGGDTDGSASGDSDRDASGAAGGDTAGNDGSANYIDSGYSVITKVNAQERMVQIRNHLS